MPSNINIKIGNAKGTSKKTGKVGWIEVLSWKWGMTLPALPGGDLSTHGRPSIQEFEITKLHDNASGDLMRFLVQGKVFSGEEDVVFKMTKTQGAKEIDFVTAKFVNCVVSSVQMLGGDAATGERVTETVTLRFSKFSYEYLGEGDSAGTIDCSYDVHATAGK